VTLRSFIDETDSSERTIAVVSDDPPGPLKAVFEETFETQSIDVETGADADSALAIEFDGTDEDLAVLIEDGTPVATSPMHELYEAILAINSDLFVTGARGLGEIELPDVLAGLEGSHLDFRAIRSLTRRNCC